MRTPVSRNATVTDAEPVLSRQAPTESMAAGVSVLGARKYHCPTKGVTLVWLGPK
jgi:hypothetical protein